MKTVGIVGLGKLGLPVAVAMAGRAHVIGYDSDLTKRKYREPYENMEKGPDGGNDFQVYFKSVYNHGKYTSANGLKFVHTLKEVVKESDIIFLAVQTPHDPELDGSTCLIAGTRPKDFDYTYLVQAAKDLAPLVRPEQTVAIISTVLPGTIRREILPILGDKCKVVYNPFFIALETTMRDFLNPEFILLGGEDTLALEAFYGEFYGQMISRTIKMSLESAELAKVAYNTFITQKISFLNHLMEMSHKIPGCDVSEVKQILKSPRLLNSFNEPGMSFGGACFPRDNVAMSWLAKKLDVFYDLNESLINCRELQTHWLSMLLTNEAFRRKLPIVILGKAFKPETNLTAGSPAMLLMNLLKERGYEFTHYDPYVTESIWLPEAHCFGHDPAAYFIATKHSCFVEYKFPKGSVILDPHRYIPKQEGVEIIPIGVGEKTK